MKSIIYCCLFGLLIITFCNNSNKNVLCNIGDEKTQLFFEYLRPYWRLHRARLRPFVFAHTIPLWRVGREVNNKVISSYSITCFYFDNTKTLVCFNSNDEMIDCKVNTNLLLLNEFVEFGIGDKKIKSNLTKNSFHYNLFPKRDLSIDIDLNKLIKKNGDRSLSIHNKDLFFSDQGFLVIDDDCWSKLDEFFQESKSAKQQLVKKFKNKNQDNYFFDQEIFIGKLIISPY